MTSPNCPGHSRRRSINACTACKQSKVRCDADGKTGEPCSRCRAQNLDCEVDIYSFDRTPVRERMKAMAAELNELRQTVREGSPNPPELHRPDAFSTIEPVSTHCIFACGSPVSIQYSDIVTEQPFGLGLQDGLSISIEPASPGPPHILGGRNIRVLQDLLRALPSSSSNTQRHDTGRRTPEEQPFSVQDHHRDLFSTLQLVAA